MTNRNDREVKNLAEHRELWTPAVESGSVRKRRNLMFRMSEAARSDDFDFFYSRFKIDDDEQVRAFALRGVARTNDDRAEDVLCSAVDDDSRFVRISALRELRHSLSDQNRRKVESLLEHDDDALRAGAAKALGRTNSKDAEPMLVRALDDRSSAVRTRVIEALITMSSQGAIPHLEARLRKENWFGRRQLRRAIDALASRE